MTTEAHRSTDEVVLFRDVGLLTFGDGLTVTRCKGDPSQLVITWEKGHRRLFLDANEAQQLVGWINAALSP
jgi:hypothetical protein